MKTTLGLAAVLCCTCISAAPVHSTVRHVWKARWIDVAGASPLDYGVYHFRRSFDLAAKPDKFIVYVSGDNRYQLYVNGVRISAGPARGDLTHWRYETVDLAPHLQAGTNLLAAVVWNDGQHRAVAQITNQTGFLLESESPNDTAVNTGKAWKAIPDKAYSVNSLPSPFPFYYANVPNEKFDATQYPWGWEQPRFDDRSWTPAHEISHAADRDARDSPNRWMLVPRDIPMEEQTPEQPLIIRSATGVTATGTLSAFTVPANTTATVLLDEKHLTTAYPELTVSGGKGATLSLGYAEALYEKRGKQLLKSNRDEIEGKIFLGPSDVYVSDGAAHRTYRPLYWRTYRYLQLHIQTAAEPITLDGLHGTFTGYPFASTAEFTTQSSSNAEIARILATGWRTARLCAHETYMDCPFYEQLQYAGDARIQMLISLYMTGDARLMKNGIELLNDSRTAEGATYSRAPSYLQQYIPPFSLWWIGMVHDYWMYVDDPAFAKSMLPGVQAVLSFYRSYQQTNGSLKKMPWWNFVDWVKQWPNGEPPANQDGTSAAALDLQLLLAYQWAADLENGLGGKALAAEYQASAKQLSATVLATDWDRAAALFADQPEHRTYSQQVNTLAVLAHVVTGDRARAVVQKMMNDPSLAQASIYFRAYANATLRQVGLGDEYTSTLAPWREMLQQGLTTWAEWNGADTRSDCHAWGASPNFEFLRTVAGIESAAPGFQRVRIAPNLGTLPDIDAKMPHPKGEILVHLKNENGHLSGTVQLPAEVTGTFEWRGTHTDLHSGRNNIRD